MTDTLTNQDYVYHLAASPDYAEDGILFAAKRSGLYKSSDCGQTWMNAYQSLGLDGPLPTTAVAVSPDFKQDHSVFAGVEGNILRSTNGGETWETSELGTPPPVVSTLVISPNFGQDGLLLAGTLQDGISRSVNGGTLWSGWNFGLLDPSIYALYFSPDFAVDKTIYAGTETGIFCSLNSGRSWREVDFPMDLAPVTSLGITSNRLFAGTEDRGLFSSQPAYDQWEPLGRGTLSGGVHQVCVDATGRILVVEDEALYLSGDGGRSWEPVTGIEAETVITCVATPLGLSPGAPLFLGLYDGRVVSTKMGASQFRGR
jgi:photosystem II stability/assembly factor-like uncharacterized protein